MNCTAYITMPPCNNCFGALYSAGINRIVTRKPYRPVLIEAASHLGIEMKSLTKDEFDNQKVRLAEFFSNDDTDIWGVFRPVSVFGCYPIGNPWPMCCIDYPLLVLIYSYMDCK